MYSAIRNLKKSIVFLGCIFSTLLIISCAGPDISVRKNQEEKIRNLGEQYFKHKNYTAALREFLKAEAIYPDDHFLQNFIGLTYREKGMLDKAIKHFNKAIELKPEYAPAMNNLGTAYILKKDWDAAIKAFNRITQDALYATPHYPLYNLGLVYYKKKEYVTAEKYYKRVLQHYDSGMKKDYWYVKTMRDLGIVYMAMDRREEAVLALKKAVNEVPDVPGAADLYFNLGEAYSLAGETKNALIAYRKALSLSQEEALNTTIKMRIKELGEKK